MDEGTGPYGDGPWEAFLPDPEVQCCSCSHCHEVALRTTDDDGRTIAGFFYICTQDELEQVVDINAWHNIYDCDYDGDGPYR